MALTQTTTHKHGLQVNTATFLGNTPLAEPYIMCNLMCYNVA